MSTWQIRAGLAALLAAALMTGACGGGGGGSRGRDSNITVTIVPAQTNVSLNGAVQFGASVTGAPQIGIATSNGAVRSMGVVTVTTTQPHGLAVGNLVLITGVTDSSFNGTFSVTAVPSATSFTHAQAGTDASSGGGNVANVSVTWSVNDVAGGNATVGTISSTGLYNAPQALPPPTTVSIAANGAVRSSNVVTITTTADHNLRVGQAVNISGVGDSSFNGTFGVTMVPSPTTFQYTQALNNATSGGGTVSSFSVRIKAASVANPESTATAIANLFSGVVVRITPTSAFLGTGESFQFQAVVSGTANTAVTWSVNGIEGGNSTVGTITPAGLYTAPATPPASNMVNIASNGAVRSSNVVTITTTSPHGFAVGQTVVIAGVSDASFNGTFTIASVATSSFTYAQTGPNANSGGGTATSVSNSVTIQARSTVDPTASASVLAFILIAEDPALTSVHPTRLPQGGVFVDLYLSGANLLSTSKVRFGGVEVPSSFANVNFIRARIPPSLLENAGTFAVEVESQGGFVTDSFDVTVEAVRPAVVGTAPDSVTQGAGAVTVTLHGGFYTPSVEASFNNAPATAFVENPQQLNVVVGGAALTESGLFPMAVRNPLAADPRVSFNLAVQPPAASPSAAGNIAVGTAPSGVAVNTATGIAVVTNRGSNNVSLVNLATSTVVGTVAVGTEPVGVAVDPLRNIAVVANRGSNNVSLVDLGTAAVTATINGVGNAPFAVGVSPLSGRAIIARQSTNTATILDLDTQTVLGTVNISTGDNPAIAVAPHLEWAVVTPGGAGQLSIVDLSRMSIVAQASVSTNVRGVAFNTETRNLLLTDPGTSGGLIFSLLDQAVTNIPDLGLGNVAAAVNPFTDIGVTVEIATDTARIIDLRTPARVASVPVGVDPRAVAIDPGSNMAIVANEGSNSVTLISLGAIRALHVEQISPTAVLASGSDLTLEILGHGFVGGSQARVEQTPVTTTVLSSRRLQAIVPASMLGAARRLAVDVVNPGGGNVHSNVATLLVIQEVAVGTAPRALAVDQERDLAVVANAGSNNVSVVDLTTGTVTGTFPVGTNPQGVGVASRAARAVVANRGSNNVTILNLEDGSEVITLSVGNGPLGVAINDDGQFAYVTNTGSNTVSAFSAVTGGDLASFNVDALPVAAAFDVSRNLLGVAHAQQNTIAFVRVADSVIVGRVSGVQIPTDLLYDPVSDRFIAISSVSNNLFVIHPDTFQATVLRAGLNPTGLDFNFHTATMVTANTASRTLSVLDFIDRRVRAIVNVDAGTSAPLNTCRQNPADAESPVQACSIDVRILPFRNLAVVADEGRNRILLIPLPR